jgi:hypothetical protein
MFGKKEDMNRVIVKKIYDLHANVDQLPLKRDWMEKTHERHAYHCFPLALSNRLGWGISFPEDIVIKWDRGGGSDPSQDRIKIISGEKFTNVDRANHTLSFETGLRFEREDGENLTLLTMPVPNEFVRGAHCFTTLVSTSALPGSLPIAWMITEPKLEITIPAGTPVASVIPISLSELQDYELVLSDDDATGFHKFMEEREKAAQAKSSTEGWSHFYRDAIDHLGNPLGKHESKKIVMKITKDK